MNKKQALKEALEWAQGQFENVEHIKIRHENNNIVIDVVATDGYCANARFYFKPEKQIPKEGERVLVWGKWQGKHNAVIRISAGSMIEKNGNIICYGEGRSKGPTSQWDNWAPLFETVKTVIACDACTNNECATCEISVPSNFVGAEK